jgi:hypothetical protein
LFDVTVRDVTKNVPIVDPAGIERLAGTVAALVRLLARVTVVAVVTALWRRTVPVTPFPPGTVVWFNPTLTRSGRRIRLAVLLVVDGYFAVIVAVAWAVTVAVVMENVAEVCCDNTLTLAGTTAPGWLLVSVTVASPGGAIPFKVTVPTAVFPDPATRSAGLTDTVVKAAAFTVKVFGLLTPEYAAVIETVPFAATPFVVTVKVAVFVPCATTTDAGTVALFRSALVSDTVIPPAGAFAERVTVPVDGFPPTTVVGLNARELRL